MDWSSSKGPSWDWSELDQQQSFPSTTHNDNNESDIDLKLGSVTQLGTSSSVVPSKIVPSKRPKSAATNSYQSTTTTAGAAAVYYCLVDDCNSDLSNCRDYHKRHKVCEVHSKTPEVTIQGKKQRFCQQCSRFHAPDEFDEGKRSCRKRLDGHNRRRRKPQPDTHSHQPTYLPNFPGAGMLSFSNRPCHTETMTSMISSNNWSGGTVNKLEDHYNTQPQLNLLDRQMSFTDYSSSRYRESKGLTFSQEHGSPQSSEHKVFYDGLVNNQAAPDSDCALSLLSRPLLPMHTTTTSTSNEISFRNVNSSQPSNQFSMMQANNVPDADVNFHNVFQTEPDVTNETQTLPFYWE